MKYKVSFTLGTDYKFAVINGYRPNWIGKRKPDYNCAQLLFDDTNVIRPGETRECLLEPLAPVLWVNIGLNDTLKCMDGFKHIADAVVIEIIE